MKISVIIPAYNAEQYIESCLKSVINQTFRDFEVIIVNDCSTDNTLEICERFANEDKRIRIISNEKNSGLRSSHIKGLTVASGELIAYIDADDIYADDMLENLYGALVKYNADLSGCEWQIFTDENNIEILNDKIDTMVFEKKEICENLIDQMYNGNIQIFYDNIGGSRCTKLWKKSILLQIANDLDIKVKYYEDLEQTLKYLHACVKIVYLKDYKGYFYRDNNSSMSKKYNKNILSGAIFTLNIIKDNAECNNLAFNNYSKIKDELVLTMISMAILSDMSITKIKQEIKELLPYLEDYSINNIKNCFKNRSFIIVLSIILILKGYICFGIVVFKAVEIANKIISR